MENILKELITEIMLLGEDTKKTSPKKQQLKPGESPEHPGYYHRGGGYYSTTQGGQVTHKTDDSGKIVPLTSTEKMAVAKNQTTPKEPSGVTKTSSPEIPNVPQSTVVPMTDAPGNIPAKPIDPATAKADKKKYDELISGIETGKITFIDDAQKERAKVFIKLWQAFVSAPTYEEQVKAVEELINHNMIEGGGGGKKIYIADTVGLPYKGMCGSSGTKVTMLMNQIIQDRGLDLPARAGSAGSKQAAESGPTNEAGVAALLDPSEENNAIYEERKSRYAEVGGDVDEIDRLNRNAAEIIKTSLPNGAKIIKAVQVGGSHELQRRYGITDPRKDPTDIVIEYESDGKKEIMKISAKIYTNPNRITMKNAGLEDAGVTYIGGSDGKLLDNLYAELRSNPELDWTETGLNEQGIKDRKNKFRQTYLKKYSEAMVALANTPEGQQHLLQMWQNVHGCGQNVSTLVVNKHTGKSELKDPSYYCEPKLPFKVKYNGTKVVIEMDTTGPQTLEINLKTETNGNAKLLFNHIVRKTKK